MEFIQTHWVGVVVGVVLLCCLGYITFWPKKSAGRNYGAEQEFGDTDPMDPDPVFVMMAQKYKKPAHLEAQGFPEMTPWQESEKKSKEWLAEAETERRQLPTLREEVTAQAGTPDATHMLAEGFPEVFSDDAYEFVETALVVVGPLNIDAAALPNSIPADQLVGGFPEETPAALPAPVAMVEGFPEEPLLSDGTRDFGHTTETPVEVIKEVSGQSSAEQTNVLNAISEAGEVEDLHKELNAANRNVALLFDECRRYEDEVARIRGYSEALQDALQIQINKKDALIFSLRERLAKVKKGGRR
jgi:hypothetical protein